MHHFDTFLSFASEDEALAQSIANALIASGFKIWFAPLNLKIGDKLLDSINVGLNISRTGVILLSPNYIRKKWTSYELDILHRQYIEEEKRLLPIWHEIDKQDLDNWNPGLSGIIGIPTSKGFDFLLNGLIETISEGAKLRGVAPIWEDPFWRFLNARGELNANTEDGPTMNLFEVMTLNDSYFPIFIDGKNYSKKELASFMAITIAHKGYDPRMEPLEEELNSIIEYCKSVGEDPDQMV